MNKQKLPILLISALLLTGCGSEVATAVAPSFITVTLPAANSPLPPAATSTSLSLIAEAITLQPVEAVTTTQLNLRSEPSTAGESLGLVTAFSTVQIVGRESNGAWYQIINPASPEGKGWVIAGYVQVRGAGEIPIIDLGPTGLILQGVYVRSGPGRDFTSLGTLVQNDVVHVTGKDAGGAWLQINFKGSAGWIASEFIRVGNAESLAVTSGQSEEAPNPLLPDSNGGPSLSAQDNDSLESPIAFANLSPTGAGGLQLNGYISTGDEADWIQFTAFNTSVSVKVNCSGNDLKVDLYQNGLIVNKDFLTCNDRRTFNTVSGQIYTLKLTTNAAAQSPTPYSVFVNIVR